jgi:hypothetical protein
MIFFNVDLLPKVVTITFFLNKHKDTYFLKHHAMSLIINNLGFSSAALSEKALATFSHMALC